MHGELPLFPEQASTVASHVDGIYFLLIAVSGVMTIAIFSTILYFAVKYRRRSETDLPKPIPGSMTLELTWSILPMFVFLGFFALGAIVYFERRDGPGCQAAGGSTSWAGSGCGTTQHLGGPSAEINGLHVPVGVPIKLDDDVAGRDLTTSRSRPSESRTTSCRGRTGTRTCRSRRRRSASITSSAANTAAPSTSRMVGWIHRHGGRRRSREWLAANSDNSAATRGRQLFLELQCITCHNRRGECPGSASRRSCS